MKQIVINIDTSGDLPEAYEYQDRNNALIEVTDIHGRKIEAGRVQISISPDGLLGLGTEIIRFLHSSDTQVHARPCTASHAVCTLGLYLHPESVELLIMKKDLGDVSSMLS